MIKLIKNKVFLENSTRVIEEDSAQAAAFSADDKNAAYKQTMAYSILSSHNTSGDENKLKIKFDALASHDITYVGIIQTARASGLEKFPVPYVLTNCHNSLCAVGGTINEDDHMFGISAAKKYGGIYVPAHIAVIHQYMREEMAAPGKMILGSDSHTRYGALGTMAIGEGGPELVKQILSRTYDINRPEVVLIYLDGAPVKGVGPQDVALAIIGEVFKSGFVKNKVMEFAGPGIKNLPIEFRNGIDVMTTETTCLSSIWATDSETEKYFESHHRPEDYKKIEPGKLAMYDGAVMVDLSKIRPMIALPFHPSNTYTIEELNDNLTSILKKVEGEALEAISAKGIKLGLCDKIERSGLRVSQGVIAGCAGGTFDNLCAAADILKGKSIGSDEFALSLYPASQPVYIELVKNGAAEALMSTGATMRTAFCGPCFGAGDVPSNEGLSIRHSTRNFPNREGSKPGAGQLASVALMDARSIAATAAKGGILTPATEFEGEINVPQFHYNDSVYKNRIYKGFGKADEKRELVLGPNITDWPKMSALTDDVLLKVVTVITDDVTTTDELIPSGETSSYRSNPEKLSEFALSRKAPYYVGAAKEVRVAERARLAGESIIDAYPQINDIFNVIKNIKSEVVLENTGIGSAIFANKPGDGSAREQAASCQKVLGGWANIAFEYATKRYRSNLINWGMLPFLAKENVFEEGDYVFVPGIKNAVENALPEITAYVIRDSKTLEITLGLGEMTKDERDIILAGCLINYYNK